MQIFCESAISIGHFEPRRSLHASRCHLVSQALLRKVMVRWQDSVEPIREGIALVELAVARHLALSVIQITFHFCYAGTC